MDLLILTNLPALVFNSIQYLLPALMYSLKVTLMVLLLVTLVALFFGSTIDTFGEVPALNLIVLGETELPVKSATAPV